MSKTSWQVKQKYNQKAYDKITVVVPKGKREEYKELAQDKGMSLNALINNLLEKENELWRNFL